MNSQSTCIVVPFEINTSKTEEYSLFQCPLRLAVALFTQVILPPSHYTNVWMEDLDVEVTYPWLACFQVGPSSRLTTESSLSWITSWVTWILCFEVSQIPFTDVFGIINAGSGAISMVLHSFDFCVSKFPFTGEKLLYNRDETIGNIHRSVMISRAVSCTPTLSVCLPLLTQGTLELSIVGARRSCARIFSRGRAHGS